MAKNKSGLPMGVTARLDRPGSYQLRCQVGGKRYCEYYRTDTVGAKLLQSELQKALDDFKERVNRGQLKNGDVTRNSTFAAAAAWFYSVRRVDTRQSTQKVDKHLIEHYLIPRIGHFKLKDITSPMITKLLVELIESGGSGGRTVYEPKPEFLEIIYARQPSRKEGGFVGIARQLGIGENTFQGVRSGDNCEKAIAEKLSKFYNIPLTEAFDEKPTRNTDGSLSAEFVSKITSTLSAVFTALVNDNVLSENPVRKAKKPRIPEKDTQPYLDDKQMPLFLDALDKLNVYDSVRVSLLLMLMLGLRSGEARGLRWCDVDFVKGIVSVKTGDGDTFDGLALTELKTRRSRRTLPLYPTLREVLILHKARQSDYARSLGSKWTDNDLVCPNTTGGLMRGGTPNKAIKTIVKQCPELPQGLHCHSLRHSFVSLLISQGRDIASIADLAGDTINIISKFYAHAFDERTAAAMDGIGSAFAEITQSPTPIYVAASNE